MAEEIIRAERAEIVEDVPMSPIVSVQQAIQAWDDFQEIVKGRMKDGYHFAEIPGTQKPSLLDAGADLLCKMYGLSDVHPTDPSNNPGYVIESMTEDWDRNPPLFDYTVSCTLYNTRTGRAVRREMASCNSYEDRYRWREQKRKCPRCKAESIIKGNEEFGGGWVCWKKKGGCGAKFADGDAEIEDQVIGRVPNEDVANQKNTILQMAQKRAKVRAVRGATLAGEMFTQDTDQMFPSGQSDGQQETDKPKSRQVQQPQRKSQSQSQPQQQSKPKAKTVSLLSDSDLQAVIDTGLESGFPTKASVTMFVYKNFGFKSIEEIPSASYVKVLEALRGGGKAPETPPEAGNEPIEETPEPAPPAKVITAEEVGKVGGAARTYLWTRGDGKHDDPLHIFLKQKLGIDSVKSIPKEALKPLMNQLARGPQSAGLEVAKQ